MSLDFAKPNYEDEEDELYTYPRNYSSQWGSPLVSGILETDRSILSPGEKAIRERYRKILDICSAHQIPRYFCESAADTVRRIYMIIERIRRNMAKSLSECLGSGRANGEECGEHIDAINKISKIKGIPVIEHPSSPQALAIVIALIRARRDINAPGDSEKELSNLIICISNRYSNDIKSEILRMADEEYRKIKTIIKDHINGQVRR